MSHPLIAAKAQLISLLAAASFSGSGNVVAHKVDTFERPGASVHLLEQTSERSTMSGMGGSTFERSQHVQITVSETVAASAGDPEDQLLTLAHSIEAAVEQSLEAGNFPAGMGITMARQRIDLQPDDPRKGVITQIYTIDYTETLTT